ncbi:hypothetical protein AB0M28_39170 [Streptomyces sp. NPDC051940]|uniref:hypothetical protein n=1 Tax=Streptomyces sp. NPDC051940 TaxID=3155675 RepID=UPI00341BF631
MNHNTPLSPRPLNHLDGTRRQVLTARQLREHGITSAAAAQRCRPGGPWQQILPGVYLLHPGPPTGEERLHSALLYAARTAGDSVPGQKGGSAPGQQGGSAPGQQAAQDGKDEAAGDVMVTGLAALALHGFTCVPPLPAVDQVDILVPRTRRLRSSGHARLVRAPALPRAQQVTGLPTAPVPRAIADAVAQLTDAASVRRLLTEAVRGGHCEPASVVRELNAQRLLTRPHVVDAVDALIAEGRAKAEDRLYEMVRLHGLPDPLWNVDLRLPGGPYLGGVDAYWPDHAVALEIDCRSPRRSAEEDDALWSQYARRRETLERLGITVVHVTPKKLREALEQQAEVVRTALVASAEREPSAYIVVLPG